ncbi:MULTISPECIES: acyltransferase family protein [unclassified Sinorhizobium]|uniref:acyltransferase family protein n=1 Tax=unclassified Sinorhizobium TaxID=2613772 RepID=UPI0035245B42
MEHRREIDGLRAIAVVPVVLSHSNFSIFRGGFVGVDIFFVISGFLITGIIIEELDKGRFSLARFYERRARRILPALFVVLLASIPFTWLWMLPDTLENFGQSVVATLLFANNILLAKTSGYWDLEAEFKPLLHTWSLGVEEQYYLLFPLLMLILWRWGRKPALVAITVVLVASLISCEISRRYHPAANFYLTTSRAWELLFGSLCAFAGFHLGRKHNEVLSAFGMILIAIAIFGYDSDVPYPSIFTLVPVVGTGLVLLFARQGTVACRILSLSPLVGIGLISYSVYLWHQPLIALARTYSPDPPSAAAMSMLVTATFVLSWLTWKYVETPFRDRSITPIRTVSVGLATVATVLIAAGLGAHLTHGFPARFFKGVDARELFIAYNESVFRFKVDEFPDDGRRNVLVMGDSTGRDFVNMIEEAGRRKDYNLVYRDDYECSGNAPPTPTLSRLFNRADVFILVYLAENCAARLTADIGNENASKVIVVGPKHFGYNLNPFLRTPLEERASARVKLMRFTLDENDIQRSTLPAGSKFVDLIRLVGDGATMPVFDENGLFLSQDRVHLTKQGAIYFSKRVFSDPALSTLN